MSVPVKKELQKICVRICLQDNSDDIDPSRNISLDIQLSQDSENGILFNSYILIL